jgi:dihydroneopterin aldolase
MKQGHNCPDYEVATELWIDEKKMSEEEIRLIETVITDIINIVLANETTGEE